MHRPPASLLYARRSASKEGPLPEDRYRRFRDLKAAEHSGVDFRICIARRDSPVAVIAPHGGTIEPGTSEIAAAMAEDDFNLYCFEGLRRGPHWHLHITSPCFDEPQCQELIAACDTVVAVHGLSGRIIDVGGRDEDLRGRVCEALRESGFSARVITTGDHAAVSTRNVCNRGRAGAGMQLEITRGLRDRILSSRGRAELITFADAVRSTLL